MLGGCCIQIHSIIDDNTVQSLRLGIPSNVTCPVDETSAEEVQRCVARHTEAGLLLECTKELVRQAILSGIDGLCPSRTIEVRDRVQLLGADILEVEHIGASALPIEVVGDALLQAHRSNRPEVLALLYFVQPIADSCAERCRQERAMTKCARADLVAALYPGNHPVLICQALA